MRVLLALSLLALAGCGLPAADPDPLPVSPARAADVDYDLTVRVSQETADGPAMPGVEVQAFALDAAGLPGTAMPRSTDTQGFARFTFEDPVRVAVRATAPGWTREGVVLSVGEAIAAEDARAIVSERDLFLPLYRSELRLTAATAVTTGTLEPGGNGSLASPLATADLALPPGLEAAYLARIAAADVRLRWEDTASSRAHVSAALAWDGKVWVRGDAPSPGVLPGPREASFTGVLPADGRPADLAAATLQAAAILESAAVGDVPLAFDVHLLLTGIEPPGLPAPCHSTMGCLVPDLPA